MAADIRRRNRSRREWLWNPGVIPFRIFESSFLTAHAGTVARYANNSYDAVLHLRPEPDDDAVQDDSALLFDRIVIDTLYTLRIPYLVAGGGVEKTLTYVADMFRLPLQRPIAEALSATDEPAPDEFPAEQPAPTTTAEELANT
ncbi:hypothetical protein [Nocardia sp. alder85J]|uniref:hypothetical protein n=1 Tax=Nocardia sp. alder85J TaxID=2862949 RepID=UPI001CD50CCB|nr:hypothetical protein [Nocardia sp. alder85J]MCX4097068.1 hypothetical protein [Nocardia sp. alder85J]